MIPESVGSVPGKRLAATFGPGGGGLRGSAQQRLCLGAPVERLPVEVPWTWRRGLKRQTRAVRRPDREGTGASGREPNARSALDVDDPDVASGVGFDCRGDPPAIRRERRVFVPETRLEQGSDTAVAVDPQKRPVGHGGIGRQIHERPCSRGDREVGASEPRPLDTLEQRDGRLIQSAIGRLERGRDQPARLRVDDMPRREILGAFTDDAAAAKQLPFTAGQSEYRRAPRIVAQDAEEHVGRAGQHLRIPVLGLALLSAS